jgi:hypothetical protein
MHRGAVLKDVRRAVVDSDHLVHAEEAARGVKDLLLPVADEERRNAQCGDYSRLNDEVPARETERERDPDGHEQHQRTRGVERLQKQC